MSSSYNYKMQSTKCSEDVPGSAQIQHRMWRYQYLLPPPLECCTAISLSCLIYLFCNAGHIKKKRLSTTRHDHILCSSFPFFKTTPCTATLANQQGLRSARTGLYIHKIKSSLSVTLFIFNHVPSMTPALCAGSIWTHWKEFPDLPRATAQLMASCCPPQKSKLLPCCLHLPSFKIKGGKKSVFYLKQTNKNQIKWNQRLFVFCCKHGLPWWQDLAWTARLWEERPGKQIPIRMLNE